MYMLREIMERVVPGNGGKVRPCEYFDVIGGSGLNALCGLLFVRFVRDFDTFCKVSVLKFLFGSV